MDDRRDDDAIAQKRGTQHQVDGLGGVKRPLRACGETERLDAGGSLSTPAELAPGAGLGFELPEVGVGPAAAAWREIDLLHPQASHEAAAA